MLSTASYYYYICRATLIAWHASDLGRMRNRVFLAFLIGIELLTNAIHTIIPGHRVMLVGHLAWALTVYAVGLAFVLIYEDKNGLEDAETDALEAEASAGARG